MNVINSKPLEAYTNFKIGPDALVTVYGKPYARSTETNDGVILRSQEGTAPKDTLVLTKHQIYTLWVHGKLEVDNNYFSERSALERARTTKGFELPPETVLRAKAVSEFVAQKIFNEDGEFYHTSENDIPKFLAVFALENMALVEEARASLARKGSKSKLFVGPRQFQRLIDKYLKSDLSPTSLIDRRDGSSSSGSTFTRECLEFQLHYADMTRTPDKPPVEPFFDLMLKENAELDVPHRMPSLSTFRRLINEANDFLNEVGRSENKQRIKRKYEFAQKGLQPTRLLQIVEMDEHTCDLKHMFTKHKIWNLLHREVQMRIVAMGRVSLSVAVDALSRSILGMVISKTSGNADVAVATLAMVAQNKDRISAAVGARSGWPQCGTAEWVHTDAGTGYVSSKFEAACMAYTGNHRIPPSKHPHLRGRVERLFGTLNKRYTWLFSGQTFSNPLMRDEYDSDKYAHLTDGEFADLLVRLIVDCYHNTKHKGIGMTPLEAWHRASQMASGGVLPPPSEEQYRDIFGTTLTRKIGNHGIWILGNIYSSQKLLEVRKKWFRAGLIVRMNEQNISKISVKHRFMNKWFDVPAVFDGLEGVTLDEWTETVRYIEKRYGFDRKHTQELVSKSLAEVRKVIARSKTRPGIVVHQDLEAKVRQIEKEMVAFEYSQPQPYDYGDYVDPHEEPDLPNTDDEADAEADEIIERSEKTMTLPPIPDDDETPDAEAVEADETADAVEYDRSGFLSDEERRSPPGEAARTPAPVSGKPQPKSSREEAKAAEPEDAPDTAEADADAASQMAPDDQAGMPPRKKSFSIERKQKETGND